jgi:hypothetical protein
LEITTTIEGDLRLLYTTHGELHTSLSLHPLASIHKKENHIEKEQDRREAHRRRISDRSTASKDKQV